ncbi:hypothetical protein [Aquibacillus sediminis]|uniref:hypothetical protein n=1 Tax=Aquibacillus sediminis TaxID=2574734 RepID=UPI00110830AC|nr:hypothetical protein [Aquibacillus sediminis]
MKRTKPIAKWILFRNIVFSVMIVFLFIFIPPADRFIDNAILLLVFVGFMVLKVIQIFISKDKMSKIARMITFVASVIVLIRDITLFY